MTRTARGRRSSGGAAKRARAPERPTQTQRPTKQARPGGNRMKSIWSAFLHDRSVRSRVVALVLLPLLGTLVLGAFFFRSSLAEAGTASEVEELSSIGVTAAEVLHRVQDERDVSGLAEAGGTGVDAVADARNATDGAINKLDDAIEGIEAGAYGPVVDDAIVSYHRETGRLPGYREQRDNKSPAFPVGGASSYHRLADAVRGIITSSSSVVDDPETARLISALDDISQTGESASLERGLFAYYLTPDVAPTTAQREDAAVLEGEQDLLFGRFLENIEDPDQARVYTNEMIIATRGIASTRSDVTNSVPARTTKEQWYTDSTTRVDAIRGIEGETVADVVSTASSATDSARLAAAVSALAVLVILALTVLLTWVVARSIVGPLRRLRAAALATAESGLPTLVSRIHRDGPAAARNLEDAVSAEGRDEIGQVAHAFNDVHSTAIRVAGEQALLRQNLDTIVVNLSRRTQSLVDRQLGEIETLESRERDPDQLSALFRIDHMATRVRRHAESLLVLAGVEEMRKHSAPSPVLDVVRTSVGEVEQYPRVKFGVMPTDFVSAGAVDDVAHLLAELIDNATEFSAPATPVTITSKPLLGGGLRLQVTDAGLGIAADQLAALNERLSSPGDIDVAASRTLGLYVVARLANKHGIRVRLEPGSNGGTNAQVDLPAQLILSPLDTGEGMFDAVTADSVLPSAAMDATGPMPAYIPQYEAPPVAPTAPPPAPPVAPPALPTLPRRSVPALSPADAPDHGAGAPAQPVRPMVEPLRPSDAPSTRPPAPAPARAVRAPAASSPSRGESIWTARQTQPINPVEPTRSLRAPEPPRSEGDAPIYESVRSAWFSKGDGPRDFSSPADAGWRRAAEALRSAEEAASARRTEQEVMARRPPAPTPPPYRAPEPEPVAASWTSGGRPGPAADEPTLSPTGLPVRRRGASLVPGSITEADAAEAARRPAARAKQDAGNVASTLSNLQRGVSRGRDESGGWVPKRPGNPERSTQ